ncbi:MAG: hypothetical protein HY319_31120 [Armatimonadetes bacterium]|nr:hypothetical protein [Armatimonadota bacterium]
MASGFGQIHAVLLDQEVVLRGHLQHNRDRFSELSVLLEANNADIERIPILAERLQSIEQRVTELERRQPPAA